MTLQSARILLVNDEDPVRLMLRQILKRAGFTNVVELANGVEASRYLADQVVDILITDIHMPHLDGWRLARMVRSGIFPSPAALPIIVVSATFCARIAEATAKEYGVNRFLTLEEKNLLPEVVRQHLEPRVSELPKPTLLVIEPNPVLRDQVLAGLTGRFEIEAVKGAEEGLATWQRRQHDLVLLSATPPDASSQEVLQVLLGQRPLQPVVIMACQSETGLCQQLMLAGAADLLPHPFTLAQLQHVCEIALRREDYLISNLQFVQRHRAVTGEGSAAFAPPTQPIVIHTLGNFQLQVTGESLPLSRRSQPKPMELLKVLIALGGVEISIDTIAEFLWPESEGDAATSALHTTLHRLRKFLRLPDAVLLKSNRVSLNGEHCWVDAFAFQEVAREIELALAPEINARPGGGAIEALAQHAQELYKGAFLERDGDPQWAMMFRERLENRYLRLLASMGRHWEEHQEWQKAVACYQRSLEVQGIGEEVQRRLMLCLRVLQRPTEAVASFQRYEKRLTRLGLSPSPTLRGLCREMQESC